MIGEPVRSPRVVSLAFAARSSPGSREARSQYAPAYCLLHGKHTGRPRHTGEVYKHFGLSKARPWPAPMFHVIGTDLATHSNLSGPPPQRSHASTHSIQHTARRGDWPHSRRRDDVRVGLSRSLAAPPPRVAAGVVGLGNQCDGALAAGATRGPRRCKSTAGERNAVTAASSRSRALSPLRLPMQCKRQSEPRRALETSLGKAFWQNHTSHHGPMHGPSSRIRPVESHGEAALHHLALQL